jgi:alanyl-tRNA synthetase
VRPEHRGLLDRGEKWDPKHLGVKLLADDIENDRYIEFGASSSASLTPSMASPRETTKSSRRRTSIPARLGANRLHSAGHPDQLRNRPLHADHQGDREDFGQAYVAELDGLPGHRRSRPLPHLRPQRWRDFSNEGRGYVLRRIIRRAMRYGQKLGIKEPFMYKLVQVVADNYKDFYPDLEGHVAEVSKMVKGEEEKFLKTLTAGEEMLRHDDGRQETP